MATSPPARRGRRLATRAVFFRRLGVNAAVAAVLVLISLAVGMVGYHGLGRLPWIDAFLNAAMILSGMGPLAPIQTSAGKLFAGCYALFSGLAFITSVGVFFAPVFHRFLHKFHLQDF